MSDNEYDDSSEDWTNDFDEELGDGEEYVSSLSSGVVSEDEDTGDFLEEFEEVYESDDSEDDSDPEDSLSSGDIVLHGELVGDEIVFSGTEEQLTEAEARDLTDSIRSTTEVLYSLVAKAHAGQAWIPLGYANFQEYVTYEFNISISKAYSLINQSDVIERLEAATPEGTQISINQSAARKLRKVMDDLIPEIEQATEGMGKREAAEYVEGRIEEVKSNQRHGSGPEGHEEYGSNAVGSYGGSGGSGNGGGFGNDGFGDPGEYDGFADSDGEPRTRTSSDADEVSIDNFDDIDLSDIDLSDIDLDDLEDGDTDGGGASEQIKNKLEASYKFYTAISALEEMPEDIDGVISSIPDGRVKQMDETFRKAFSWMSEFQEKWNKKMSDFDEQAIEPLEQELEEPLDNDDSSTSGDIGGDFDGGDFEEFTDSNKE